MFGAERGALEVVVRSDRNRCHKVPGEEDSNSLGTPIEVVEHRHPMVELLLEVHPVLIPYPQFAKAEGDQVAFQLGDLQQDPGVPTLVAAGLWDRHLRSSHDLESLTVRHAAGTSNRAVVQQVIRDPMNAAEDALVAT